MSATLPDLLSNKHDYDISRNIMNNKVFYQHPNLMRALGMHETVMEVMVNVLGGGGDSKVTAMFVLFFKIKEPAGLSFSCTRGSAKDTI